jgi:hypothetical protein
LGTLHAASVARTSAGGAASGVRSESRARDEATTRPRPPRKRATAAPVQKFAGFAAAALPKWLKRGVDATPSAFETDNRSGGSALTLPTVAALVAALLAYASFRWTAAFGTPRRRR